MGLFRQGGLGWGCGWVGAVAVVGFGCAGVGFGAVRRAAKVSPWDAAVAARESFEAEPAGTHTKVEYAAVMDGFRAIYHDDPSDAHAARAVEQVAELLEEQGTELGDKKSLKDAAGQFAFLEKAYPAYVQAEKRRLAAAKLGGDEVVGVTRVGAPVSGGAAEAKRSSPSGVTNEEGDRLEKVSDPAEGSVPMAVVTGIRHWSTGTYTRVAIDLSVVGDGDVKYEAARVEHPDRLFFDLHHAKLTPGMVGKSFSITDDGFLTKIRAAPAGDDVTRVVLDVKQVGEYSAFLLPNPLRLIIDIHGKTENREERRETSAADEVVTTSPVKADSVGEARSEASNPKAVADEAVGLQAATAPPRAVVVPQAKATPAPIVRLGPSVGTATAEVSSLPPMPVTDGSAAFGLPAKSTNSTKASVAQPRVVIPSKPTVARPVPNTVAKSSAANSTEVVAVSGQPGKVEATPAPTSQPVSSGSQVASDHYVPRSKRRAGASPAETSDKPLTHESGTPVEAPPPTADGETSLVRALGLKIGRIVIDAGHGGHDSGTLGVGGIEEKDVVLDVALRLGKLLHDRLGAEIVYTRADDTFIPLETRTAIANKAQADLFISVHANSSQEPSARGVEVYYLNFTSDPEAMKVASRENAVSTQSVHELSDLVKKIALKDKIEESKELAGDVDASLYAGLRQGNDGLRDRGVKKAPFVVLIGANMPSILAEISFVTNPDDAEQLGRPEYRERVAESLYGGVAKYAAGINGRAKTKVKLAAR